MLCFDMCQSLLFLADDEQKSHLECRTRKRKDQLMYTYQRFFSTSPMYRTFFYFKIYFYSFVLIDNECLQLKITSDRSLVPFDAMRIRRATQTSLHNLRERAEVIDRLKVRRKGSQVCSSPRSTRA